MSCAGKGKQQVTGNKMHFCNEKEILATDNRKAMWLLSIKVKKSEKNDPDT